MTQLTESATPNHLHSRHGRQATVLLGLLMASAIALTWSWNEVGASLLGLPPAQFKHAVAPLIALTLITFLVRSICTWNAKA